ncbi:hypothetical protein ACFPKZ_02970 [Streptosporangium amethystogenes subsp. fukuiense]|uniref:hypothetical protein n=1 Tax=Streptosporangium amethystogenes TaxID=2002 RepID=UPI0036245952
MSQRNWTLPENASPTTQVTPRRGLGMSGRAAVSSRPGGRVRRPSSRPVAASGRRLALGTRWLRAPSSPAWWASTAQSICSGDSTQAMAEP